MTRSHLPPVPDALQCRTATAEVAPLRLARWTSATGVAPVVPQPLLTTKQSLRVVVAATLCLGRVRMAFPAHWITSVEGAALVAATADWVMVAALEEVLVVPLVWLLLTTKVVMGPAGSCTLGLPGSSPAQMWLPRPWLHLQLWWRLRPLLWLWLPARLRLWL
jgi:hypothetical protein